MIIYICVYEVVNDNSIGQYIGGILVMVNVNNYNR